MNRKIDLNQSPLRKHLPWRTMLFTAMLCLLTSVYSFGQVSSLDAQMVSYEAYLASIDQSTPDGVAAYQAMVNKIEGQILSSYSSMTPADQAAFLDWLSHHSNTSSPLFSSSSTALHKFQVGLEAAAQDAINNPVTQPSAGNFVINGVAPTPVNVPVKSPYTDTYPEDPIK